MKKTIIKSNLNRNCTLYISGQPFVMPYSTWNGPPGLFKDKRE